MPTAEVSVPQARLPPGYTARPVGLADAEAAAVLENAHEMALTGKPGITAEEIRGDWGQPALDRATNALAVFAPGGTMAGIAELWDSAPHVQHFVFALVHPGHQGQAIGTALAGWAEERARQLLERAPAGARVVMQQFKLSSDEAAARLLCGRGYVVVRHNLRMTIDLDGPPALPDVPGGLTIRPFVRGREDRALIMAIREEFRDHWGHVEPPFAEEYAEWQHFMDTRPGWDPSLWFVAMDGDEIAGTALCQAKRSEDPEAGWIFGLGVRRPWRRRGLALALLQHCFVALHAYGKRRASLGVDAQSLTGARRLYEKAGMRLERQYASYEKELRPGRDLGTQAVA